MTTPDNWLATQSGIAYPPQPVRRDPGHNAELLEAVRHEFDGAISTLLEAIDPFQSLC